MEALKGLSRPPEEQTNNALFLRYQQYRDESAFNSIYERFRPELRAFIKCHLEGALAADVDDILQETFCDVHRCRHQWRPGTHLRPWLYKIAQHNLNDRLKAAEAKKRDHHITRPLTDETHSRGGKVRRAEEAKQELDELMAKLPPHEAEALRLVDLEGHTIRSAAEALGLPESTVWSRVRSGRKRLKELGGD